MTKYEKVSTLIALKNDAKERWQKEQNPSLKQYEKGRMDALSEAIDVVQNNSLGNAIKDAYLGKEMKGSETIRVPQK